MGYISCYPLPRFPLFTESVRGMLPDIALYIINQAVCNENLDASNEICLIKIVSDDQSDSRSGVIKENKLNWSSPGRLADTHIV